MLFNIHIEGESIIKTYLSALSRPIIVRNKHAVIMIYYYVDSKTTTTCTRLASTAVASKFSTIPTMMVDNNENNSEFEASEIDDDDYVSDVGSFLETMRMTMAFTSVMVTLVLVPMAPSTTAMMMIILSKPPHGVSKHEIVSI